MLKKALAEAVLITALNNVAMNLEVEQVKSSIKFFVNTQDIIQLSNQLAALLEDATKYVDPAVFEIAQDIKKQFNGNKNSPHYKNAGRICALLRSKAYERIE